MKLLVLIFHIALADTCFLMRNLDDCSSTTWPEEYECTAKQNSMWDIMNCVRKDPNDENNKNQDVCRDPIDTISGWDNYDEWDLPNDYQGICLTPRMVLINRSLKYCSHCKMTGALRACPRDDPRFVHCLCEQNAKPRHFTCLAECFMLDDSTSGMADEVCADNFDFSKLRARLESHVPQLDQNHDRSGKRQQVELLVNGNMTILTDYVQQSTREFPTQTIRSSYWMSSTVPPLSIEYTTTLSSASESKALVICTVDATINYKICTTSSCGSDYTVTRTASTMSLSYESNAAMATQESDFSSGVLPTPTSSTGPSTPTNQSATPNNGHILRIDVMGMTLCLILALVYLV
ncbi:hypothetical protein SCUP234_07909 [Seiridium cupressi]